MFERNIYDQYRLFCDQKWSIAGFEGFSSDGKNYLLIPGDLDIARELEQAIAMGKYLKTYGETGIADFIRTVNGEQTALVDGQSVFLFQLPEGDIGRSQPMISTGEKLARFHQKGMRFQHTNSTYFGQWKLFWERRLSQLEQWYQYILRQPQKTIVDEAFLVSFPYYMGLTENAIQYVVDTELDEINKEQIPTICHRRFTNKTWLLLVRKNKQPNEIKLPTEWITDHPVRDVSEYVRDQLINEQNHMPNIFEFVQKYNQVLPLSKYGWRLFYARLLFPLHYFEAMEGYYGKRANEQYVLKILELEERNQQFLHNFYDKFQIPANRYNIPVIDWLQ